MKKLYTIMSNVFVSSLNLQGPITTPTRMDEVEAIDLMKSGAQVYEHNPAYPKEKYLLTRDNYRGIVFKKTRKQAAKERAQGMNTTVVETVRRQNRKHHVAQEVQKEMPKEKEVILVEAPKKNEEKPKNLDRPDDFQSV